MKQEISTIMDNTIERNCSKCIHNETCKYIDSFRRAVEDIINTLKSISLPISLDITCNHRKRSVDTITHDDVISANNTNNTCVNMLDMDDLK